MRARPKSLSEEELKEDVSVLKRAKVMVVEGKGDEEMIGEVGKKVSENVNAEILYLQEDEQIIEVSKANNPEMAEDVKVGIVKPYDESKLDK